MSDLESIDFIELIGGAVVGVVAAVVIIVLTTRYRSRW